MILNEWNDVETYISNFEINLTLDQLSIFHNCDAISKCQLASKLWLINQNADTLQTCNYVIICGSWIGLLTKIINDVFPHLYIDEIDIDEHSVNQSQKLNVSSQINSYVGDMYNWNYDKYDCIINTSSEHLKSISKWIKQITMGKNLIIQNTNNSIPSDHYSFSISKGHFEEQLGNNVSIIKSGELHLPIYRRFMIYGKRQ